MHSSVPPDRVQSHSLATHKSSSSTRNFFLSRFASASLSVSRNLGTEISHSFKTDSALSSVTSLFCTQKYYYVFVLLFYLFFVNIEKQQTAPSSCTTSQHKRYNSLGQHKSEGKHTNGHTKRALVGHTNRRTSGVSTASPFCRSGTYTTVKVTSGNVLVLSTYCSNRAGKLAAGTVEAESSRIKTLSSLPRIQNASVQSVL